MLISQPRIAAQNLLVAFGWALSEDRFSSMFAGGGHGRGIWRRTC
jgi:hypothetical protein